MNDEALPQQADGTRGRDQQTLGASTLYNLLDAFIKMSGRNDATHKNFDRMLISVRDELKTSFNSFAADTQRAYIQLRNDIQGEKRTNLALLNLLLEVSQDLTEIIAVRPAPDDPEAVTKWIEAVEVESRKVEAALKRNGVHPYDAVIATPYDPKMHERVGSKRVEGMGPNLVAEQRERGFASQQPEFVLRRPKVIVSE
jgi:molecular chaperone GrpE (heat shock protein)